MQISFPNSSSQTKFSEYLVKMENLCLDIIKPNENIEAKTGMRINDSEYSIFNFQRSEFVEIKATFSPY